jgi:hypothetical protein
VTFSEQTGRVEVTFEVRHHPDGQPYIGIVLIRTEKLLRTDERFSLGLRPDLTETEAGLLVNVLNRSVTHLGMTAPDDPEPKT